MQPKRFSYPVGCAIIGLTMFGGPMRLRRRRRTHAVRRRGGSRAPLVIGALALVLGVACWGPLTPLALTPLAPAEPIAAAPAHPTPAASAPGAANPDGAPPAVIAVPTLAPVPTLALAPRPPTVPTSTPTGQALLAGVRADATAHWLKNHAETALRSGPSEDAQPFTDLPQWSTLRQVDARPDWLLVQYGGDGDTRQPGPGWVKAADVGAIDPPSIWLSSARQTSVWSAADATGQRTLDVPAAALMEVLDPATASGPRVHVRLPGDGRQVPPSQGWLDADAATRSASPNAWQLPRAYPADLRADVRINVPYRTQLDGSAYAGSNCGPTALGMALEAFGLNEPAPDLRYEVLRSETFDEDDDEAGSYIWALARVAESKGLVARGLYEDDGQTLHRWSADEVRAAVRSGRPVILQVVYRGLPERQDSGYYGDHYVVVTGLLGDDFLYNDPIGGPGAHEAPGYDRLMTTAELSRAMRASDAPYAYTAFSLGRT